MLAPRPSPTVLGVLLVALAPLRRAARCYGIDGTPKDDSFQPCNPGAVFSACCATNKERPDVCLSSGLCYAQAAGFEGFIYSNGCTDPTGRAEACPHLCPDRTNNWKGGPVIGSYNVLQCREGRFCCRKALDATNCCDTEGAVVGINVGQLQLPTGTATAGAAATVTVTSAVCGDAARSGRAVVDGQCPEDRSAVVGGAVGGVLGAALLACLGVVAFLCMRRPKGCYSHDGSVACVDGSASRAPPHELPSRPVLEMQGG